MIAYIEERWIDRLQKETLFRYEFPTGSFESLDDAGMWVSREEVRPVTCSKPGGLPTLLIQTA